MKNIPLPVEQVKAEAFLTSFMDSCSDVIVESQGVFSRNYNDDIVSIDSDDNPGQKLTIQLSRDGLFHILPESLFFTENKLREIGKKGNTEKFKQEEERITKEKQKIKSFFQPFDMTYFKLRFELEKQLNQLAANRTQIIVDELFDIYQLNSKNPFIHKTISLIPIISEIRGNKQVLKNILKVLFYPSKVEMFLIKSQNASGQKRTLLKINLLIKKISSKQYTTLKKEIDEFAIFFYEWFLPVDMGIEVKIKDKDERFILGKAMTLDYNTYL